ncbi:hypothetical protein O5541_05645 [Escherichia coli]|nr:hypothetical protein [Escherichia coli]
MVQEGFPTYGGLEGGAMEGGLAVGLYDGMNLGLAGLSYRAGTVSGRWSGRDWRCLASRRAVTRHSLMPVSCLPHIPADQFPARRWRASCIKSPVSVR